MGKAKYNVLIVEDILDAQELLKSYINKRDDLNLSEIASDGQEALHNLLSENYDLLFIDIDLPYLTGIEVLDEFNKQKKNTMYIIFTTAYDQYAVKAFDLNAIDYLLKPFSFERFNQAVDKFILLAKNNTDFSFSLDNHCLLFKEKRKQRVIPYEDIFYLSSHASQEKKTIIHAKLNDFETCGFLKEMEEKLPQSIFIRIHKQYIINIAYVIGMEYDSGSQYIVKLNNEDDTRLPVGKNYVGLLKERLGI